jgi:hypothetical protein
MAQISSYPLLTPQLGDSLLGSNTVDSSGVEVTGNPTVQYSISSIKDVVAQYYVQELSAANESTFQPDNSNAGNIITFGAAQNTTVDNVMIDVAGKLTFNTAGSYIIQQIYYAQGTTADVTLNFKTVKNGATQEGPTSTIRFINPSANERRPVYIQSYVNIIVPGTYYNFWIQNPLSSAVGSLAALTVAAGFGTVIPSAQLIITKLT